MSLAKNDAVNSGSMSPTQTRQKTISLEPKILGYLEIFLSLFTLFS
jgi:hypothetical protein